MQKADGRRRADADSRRWRISSRQAFRRVRRAYAEGREGGLQAAYADVRWRTRGIRPLLALADRMYPMTEAIELAGEMDRRIREDGLSSACAAGAERLGLDCEFVMSEATREVLTASPQAIGIGPRPVGLGHAVLDDLDISGRQQQPGVVGQFQRLAHVDQRFYRLS